jgi:hypothetical protein
MTEIGQYNTHAGKPINRSDRYWKERAREDKMNRGAPEDPYAPTYAKASRSATTKALSLAPKETNTLDFLEALQNLSDATLEWTTQPSNKSEARKGIIKLNGQSVTIEYTYDTNLGINNLKWGDKEIIVNENITVEVTEETKSLMYGLLGGLKTAWIYACDSIKPMNFLDLQKLQPTKLDEITTRVFGNHALGPMFRPQGGINKRHTSP